jgi:hypothetical protein
MGGKAKKRKGTLKDKGAIKKKQATANVSDQGRGGASFSTPTGSPALRTPKAASLQPDPRAVEEARQAQKLLDQITPMAVWKSSIREKERDRRLDCALRRQTALEQALLTLDAQAASDGKPILEKLKETVDHINNVVSAFTKIKAADDMCKLCQNGDDSLNVLRTLDSDLDCLSAVLMAIGGKVVEAILPYSTLRS